jgi:probable H4MPT-linked C1 transfer pathway protein
MNGSLSSNAKPYVGIDIGGANIKLAIINFGEDSSAQTIQRVEEFDFEFWNRRDELSHVLQRIDSSLPTSCLLTVTMTAELADCFDNKQQGVQFVANAVKSAFPNRKPLFYATDGNLHPASFANSGWALIAAANWHASAWYVFKTNNISSGFLIDIGSTTTDIIPVTHGQPAIGQQTDIDRLSNGQLLYAGIGRTPIATLIDHVAFGQHRVNVARELFATIADALLWLNLIDESPNNTATADGRRLTVAASRKRLCRMVCADTQDLSDQQVHAIAQATVDKLLALVKKNLHAVISQFPKIPFVFLLTGRGSDIAKQAIELVCDGQQNSVQIKTIAATPLIRQATPAIAVAHRRRLHEQSKTCGDNCV